MGADDKPVVKPSWTFLTNHAHVLLCIAADPGIRGRDIAERVGITERSAQSIVSDLVEGGYEHYVPRQTHRGPKTHWGVRGYQQGRQGRRS